MSKLKIGTAAASPGEKKWGRLLIGSGRQALTIPVAVLNGRNAGPHLVLIANQHGTEINGFAAIREFVRRVNPETMRGTIAAFPTVNPLAARIHEKSWLDNHEGEHPRFDTQLTVYNDPYNMNGNWPGRKDGTLAQRTVYQIWNEAVMTAECRAVFVVDIHSHQAAGAVYVRNSIAADLGLLTGFKHIVITGGEGKMPTLNAVCVRHNIMALTLEPEGQLAFYPHAVAATCQALCNLAIFWKLFPGVMKLPREAFILDPWKSQRLKLPANQASCHTCYAQHAGLFLTGKRQYDQVVKNETVGEILDPHTARVIETIRAPMAGALYMLRTVPAAIAGGDRLLTVSVCRKVTRRNYAALKKIDCSLYMRPEIINAPAFNGMP